jgi:hypothetical protein
MAESPDSIVIAVRQVINEVRAKNIMADVRTEAPKPVEWALGHTHAERRREHSQSALN